MTDIRAYDAESIEVLPDGPVMPVDPPTRKVTFADVVGQANERRPIVPASLRSKEGRRSLVLLVVAAATHGAGYHLARSPWYGLKVAFYAPIGAGRIVWRAGRWAAAEEGNHHLRQQAANRGDVDAWLALDRQRAKSSSGRWWVFGLLAFLVVAAALCTRFLAPGWAQFFVVVGAALVLARYGRPAERPILSQAFNESRFIRLTAELTRAALVASGAGIKDPSSIRFNREIYRDGPGYTAEVSLPTGVIAADVIDKRDYLAAGFQLPMAQVWPEPVRNTHPGVLGVWVADRPVDQMKQRATSLLTCDPTDYWGPMPWGDDIRVRDVTWRLAERNSMFAGMVGSGKTLAARNVALAAAMDPLVRFVISELKGSGDFDAFEPLCLAGWPSLPRMYASGADDQAKRDTMALLRWLDKECDRRGPAIRKWVVKGLNTQNKLNRAISEADPTLPPLVAIFDELQELITDPDLGKEAKRLLTSIIKRARALGLHIILSTQRIDKESVPKGITSNVSNRLCLAVPSHVETDLVLGTGAYSRGARPTTFVPPADDENPWAGWGYLAGREQPVRASYIDNPTAEAIVQRALALRGEIPDVDVTPEPDRDVLSDVVKVFAHIGRPALSWQKLAELLAAEMPGLYDGVTPEAVSALVRGEGVTSGNVKTDGQVLKGCRLDDVQKVAARRELGE